MKTQHIANMTAIKLRDFQNRGVNFNRMSDIWAMLEIMTGLSINNSFTNREIKKIACHVTMGTISDFIKMCNLDNSFALEFRNWATKDEGNFISD